MLYLHRYLFAFVKPALATEWGLSNTQLGRIDSAFLLGYSVLQIPFAAAADVFGVHLVLTGLIFTWCAGLAGMAWAPSPGWMLGAQAAMGTGQSAVFACFSRIARFWFPPRIRTTMLSVVGVMAARLGALSSSLVFTALLLGWFGLTWRTAVWILVAVAAAVLLAFAILFRNSPRGHPWVNQAEAELIEGPVPPAPAPELVGSLRSQWRKTSPRSLANLGCLSLQLTLSSFADTIFSNWIPLFLVRVHHLEFKKLGVYAALPLLGGAIAGLFGGALNDVIIARTGNRRWARAGVALVGKGLGAALIVAALAYYDQPYVFCVFLFFVKLFGDFGLASSWGATTDIGGRATASVFAIANTTAAIGTIFAPIFFGYVADHHGWRDVFLAAAAVEGLCALSWLGIDCNLPVFKESHSTPREAP